MKKSIFIFAALFAATFANAQIELIHTFDEEVCEVMHNREDKYTRYNLPYLETPYLYTSDVQYNTDNIYTINFYNFSDFSLYKSVIINEPSIQLNYYRVSLVSRNILSTDDKVCFSLCARDAEGAGPSYICNEDGLVIAILKGSWPALIKLNGNYYLKTIERVDYNGHYKTHIYSVPGNGEVTDVDEVSVPQRNIARKYINNDQVLIDSNERTYTIQGQEVK